MKPDFSVEVPIDAKNWSRIEDVQHATTSVYKFVRSYNKETNKISLYYLSMSSEGFVSRKKQEILKVTSDHHEFVDFKMYPNPGKTKFLVKSLHKASKDDNYETDFILLDATNMEIAVKFTMNGLGFSDNDIGFFGLYLDDKDNVYYAFSYYAQNSTDKEKQYEAAVSGNVHSLQNHQLLPCSCRTYSIPSCRSGNSCAFSISTFVIF